jgi:hypothetical protein
MGQSVDSPVGSVAPALPSLIVGSGPSSPGSAWPHSGPTAPNLQMTRAGSRPLAGGLSRPCSLGASAGRSWRHGRAEQPRAAAPNRPRTQPGLLPATSSGWPSTASSAAGRSGARSSSWVAGSWSCRAARPCRQPRAWRCGCRYASWPECDGSSAGVACGSCGSRSGSRGGCWRCGSRTRMGCGSASWRCRRSIRCAAVADPQLRLLPGLPRWRGPVPGRCIRPTGGDDRGPAAASPLPRVLDNANARG